MSREIKFRAWDKSTKKMLFPSEIHFLSNTYYLSCNWEGVGFVNTRFSELMQFTGLHDKNNKPIFEGDILKLADSDHLNWEMVGEVVSVEWKAPRFRIKNKRGVTGIVDESDSEYVKIIGNIYEHPDLLSPSAKPDEEKL